MNRTLSCVLLRVFLILMLSISGSIAQADYTMFSNIDRGSKIRLSSSANSNYLLSRSIPFYHHSLASRRNDGLSFFAESYTKHYIAPAPWQYWSKANELVVTTESLTPVTVKVYKSDGTLITTFTVTSKNNSQPYRFTGLPKDAPAHPLNKVISGAGLIVEGTASISVNLRNIASDELGTDGSDADIKGNASLFSFGDAAIGNAFRIGYYRDGHVNQNEDPIYSIMAIGNNTTIKIGGVAKTTLNAGESYLFNAPIGTLVESSGSAVMNTSARLDAPLGCGDGAYNPIAPISSLGSEYVVVRGEGNPTAEQTTLVATEANTQVTVYDFDAAGVPYGSRTFNLPLAGSWVSFPHGYLTGAYNSNTNSGKYSSSRIVATKKIAAYSGTAGGTSRGCEVDVATLVPISDCSGSKQVETYKFRAYKGSNLGYFGYILIRDPLEKVFLTTQGGNTGYNHRDIETIAGVGLRKPLGTSGLYLITFTNTAIGSPNVIAITSNVRLTVSAVQQGNNSSMSNFISRFPEKALLPAFTQTDCTSATLSADPTSTAPYQWYLDGVMIQGATASTYQAQVSGNYSITSKLECGISDQSLPATILLCNIDRSVTKVVDVTNPELNSNINFVLTAKNLGNGNAIGVSVNDLLPDGFSYISSTPSAGTSYNALTGVWSIGNLQSNGTATLAVQAKVIRAGVNTNTAKITGPQPDGNPSNDESSVSTFTIPGTIDLITGSDAQTVCVNTAITDIVYLIGGGATGVTVSGLSASLSAVYDVTTKQVTIRGIPDTPGNFTYTLTTSGGVSMSKTGTITVRPNVVAPVFNSGLTNARCIGQGNDTYKATASNAIGILYSLSPSAAGTIDPVSGVLAWAADFSGTAKIKATAAGCNEKSMEFSVMVNPLLAPPTVMDVVYCQNAPAVALSAGGTNLIWYDGNKNLLAGAPVPLTTTAGSTDYFVSDKSATGCEGPLSQIRVTVNALPSAPTVTDVVYCQNGLAVALSAGGTNLIWYDGNKNLLAGAPVPLTTTAGSTDYFVSDKNATGCEGPLSRIRVTVNALPSAPTVTDVVYCQNGPAVALSAGGTNLIWYDGNKNLLAGAPVPLTTTAGSTDYFVSDKNATGCEGPLSRIRVTVNALPEASSVTISGSETFCMGESRVLTASAAQGYQWYKNNILIPGATGQTLSVSTTGQYQVITRSQDGCEGPASAVTTIKVNPIPVKPVITSETVLTVCEGDLITLRSSAALGNQWYKNNVIIPGAIYQVYQPTTSGNYLVMVASEGNCNSVPSDPVTVKINAKPVQPNISTEDALTICQGSAAVLFSSSLTGNQWYKNGIAIPGANGNTYSAISVGEYSLIVTNENGCKSLISNRISIAVDDFKLQLQSDVQEADYGTRINLTTRANTGYKITSWSPQNLFTDQHEKKQVFELKQTTTITINAVSENGCIASAHLTIQLKKVRDLYIPNTFTPNFDGKNDVVKVYGTNLDIIEWFIYTQWGELIFRSKELDGQWDGTYKGVMQPVGVYVYKCIVHFKDGEEVVKHGAINLVR